MLTKPKKMNLKENAKSKGRFLVQTLLLLMLCLCFSTCDTLKSLKKTGQDMSTTLKKVDKILDKADTSTIEPITRNAARGFVSGVDLESMKVQGFVDNLLKELDGALSREMGELKLKGFSTELSQNLRAVLDNDSLRLSFKKLLSDVLLDVEKRKVKVNVDLNLNDEELLQIVEDLKSGLLNDSTAAGLSKVLDDALLGLAKGGGLDSLLSKVNASIADVDRRLAEQNKSWRKFLTKLGLIVGALLLLGILAIAYFFRKRGQYKRLATVLTKGIDQIADRGDYDRILTLINNQVDAQQVRKQLIGILQAHQGEYPGKTQHINYADRTLKLLREALNGNQEIRDKILDQAKAEPQWMQFVQHKLN